MVRSQVAGSVFPVTPRANRAEVVEPTSVLSVAMGISSLMAGVSRLTLAEYAPEVPS